MMPTPLWVFIAFAARGAACVAGLLALAAFVVWVEAADRWARWGIAKPFWREGVRYARARAGGRNPLDAARYAAQRDDHPGP